MHLLSNFLEEKKMLLHPSWGVFPYYRGERLFMGWPRNGVRGGRNYGAGSRVGSGRGRMSKGRRMQWVGRGTRVGRE